MLWSTPGSVREEDFGEGGLGGVGEQSSMRSTGLCSWGWLQDVMQLLFPSCLSLSPSPPVALKTLILNLVAALQIWKLHEGEIRYLSFDLARGLNSSNVLDFGVAGIVNMDNIWGGTVEVVVGGLNAEAPLLLNY